MGCYGRFGRKAHIPEDGIFAAGQSRLSFIAMIECCLLTSSSYIDRMSYRLNLYSNAKLTSTELLEASLEDAKSLACSALDRGEGHRAELLNTRGVIMFQRWAVL